MIEKLNRFLFSKVNSSYSQDELTILYNQFYSRYKLNKDCKQYLIGDNFKSFASNFVTDLTEEQKNDFEKISAPRKGFFSTLFNATFFFKRLVNKNKKTKEGKVFLIRFHILNEIQKEVFCTVANEESFNKLNFSKTDIANEFEVDKKTLNKWLELLKLKHKYSERKQLNFLEYNDIFKKLFVESDEDFDLKNKFEEYNIRLEEKKKLSKTNIIRLGFGLTEPPKIKDYEKAQEIIEENKDFYFYPNHDKYPYSIAIKLINYLKKNKFN
ncbi:hypothetical protein [Flavobacterium sp. U410]